MITRLLNFYKTFIAKNPIEHSEVWETMENIYQKKAIEVLKAQDPAGLQLVLDVAASTGSFGIEHSTRAGESLKKHLLDLYHHIGIVPVFNPEQPWINNHTPSSLDEFRVAAEMAIGVPINPGNIYGFDAGNGIPYRYLFYLSGAYAASSQLGRNPNRVLELGAGFGDLGYIASKWKSSCYTVIDLPQTAVLSAYFMSQCVGEQNVWLQGEPENSAFARFYAANDYLAVGKLEPYDLIWNSDSLPEMTLKSQDDYLKLFASVLSRDGIFVSINQEVCSNGQFRVFDAVQRHGGFRSVARFPFMMRPGYMVEIFKLNK